MKSIVDKLEPMMEQSNVLKKGVDKKAAHDTAGWVSNVVSSVMVDTTGLESNLFNYLVDENEEPFDYGVAGGGGLDLNIAVTSKLRDNKKGATEIIDLNQEIPFQNENNCIKEATASCKLEIEQVDTQDEVVTVPTTTTTTTIADHQTTDTKTKECDNSMLNPLPISNTALANLLYEYQLEAYESTSTNHEESCTSSTSIVEEGNNKQHENQQSTAAPPQKDDYLTSILEEYSPFYNFPTDDETSEVERTYYNPYKIVFAGEF